MRCRLVIGVASVLTLAACSGSGSAQSRAANGQSTAGAETTTPITEPGVKVVDVCRWMTTDDASRLLVHDVVQVAWKPGKTGRCRFAAPADASSSAEIQAKVAFSPASAQAEYPTWVQSTADGPGFETVPLPNVADQATLVHSPTFDAILFRHDTVLVRIGASPQAADEALQEVATAVLGRLQQPRRSG